MLDTREIFPLLLDKTNERMTFLDLFRFDEERMVKTDQTNFHQFYNTELFETMTINGVPTDVPTGSLPTGTVVDIVVTAANGTSFAQVDDIVQFPGSNRRIGQVIAKTADAGGDILRVKGVANVSLQAATTQVLSVVGSAKGEGGKFSTARKYPVVKRSNWIQIFADTICEITDIQKMSTVEVKINGENKWMPKLMLDGETVFKKKIALSMLFNEPTSQDNFPASTPTLTDADGNALNVTRGLNSYIAQSGITLSSVTINNAFFDTLTRQLNKARCGTRYSVWGGSEMSIAWDNFFQALGSADISDAARWLISGDSLTLGIKNVRYHDRDFAKMPMSIFDDQATVSFTGSAGYEKFMFFVPWDEIKTVGGASQKRIRCRYMEVPAGNGPNSVSNGIYRQTMLGNYAPTPTSDERKLKITEEAKLGLEVLGADHFVRAILA